MKSLIIPIILILIGLYGLGEFHFQLWPFKLKMEKPYQFLGAIFLMFSLMLFREQVEKDTQKRIYQQLQDELQKAVEQSIQSNQII